MSRGIALLVLALAVASLDAEQIRLRFVPASVGGGGGGDEHAYFDTLTARTDCYAGWSLRPQEGETLGSGELADMLAAGCDTPHYENQLMPKSGTAIAKGFRNGSSLVTGESTYRVTYDCATCGNGLAHNASGALDAAKLTIPAWIKTQLTLASGINDTETTITLSGTGGPTMGTTRGVKIDDEIIVLTQTDPSTGPLQNVSRGQFGTVATSHSAGAEVYVSFNSVGTDDYLVIPIRGDGTEETSWLFTWDAWHSEDWVGFTGELTAYKEFQIVNYTDRWWEVQPQFDACANGNPLGVTHPSCVADTHIGSMAARIYTNTMTPMAGKYPARPVVSPFLLEHGKWQRYWFHVQQRLESNGNNYSNVTTLAASMDASTPTMSINHPNNLAISDSGGSLGNSIFYGGYVQPNGTAPGRIVKIGSELIEVESCPTTGTTRNCTVERGFHGTAAVEHASGADVAVQHDLASFWMADEDSAATLIFEDVPVYLQMYESTAANRGTIKEFWFEYDTSSADAFQNRYERNWSDLVVYLRNFVALKGIALGDVDALLEQPVGASTPPPSVIWRDLQVLIVIGLLAYAVVRGYRWATTKYSSSRMRGAPMRSPAQRSGMISC